MTELQYYAGWIVLSLTIILSKDKWLRIASGIMMLILWLIGIKKSL